MKSRRPISKTVTILSVPFVSLIGVPVCEWLTVGPAGNVIFQEVELLFALAFLPFICATLITPFLMLKRDIRSSAAFVFCFSATCTVLLLAGFWLGIRIRRHAFEDLAIRSEPLLQAIRAYASDNGKPPESLNALVPKYLASVPATGMVAYPTYEFVSGGRAKEYNENPWALYVPASSGVGNWDSFLYLPRQNYPDEGYGGTLERIGDWAYVHE